MTRAATTDVIPGVAGLSVGLPGREAPPGWRWVRLTHVARLESGHTPSRRHPEYWNGDVPWLTLPDARVHHGKVITETSQMINDAGLAHSAARLLPVGTVCLSRTASVGNVTRLGRPMATSQDFVNWVCSPALDPRFLMYAILAEGDHLLEFGKGTTHTTIYFPEVLAFHICMPGRAEQERIVEKVEALLAQVSAARERLTRVREILKRFRQSVLAAACSGTLVADSSNEPLRTSDREAESSAPSRPHGQHDLPQGWRWVRFGDLVLSLRSGTTQVPQDIPTSFPVLRSSSVRPRSVDLEDVRYLDCKRARPEDCIHDGDLLITRLSGSLEYVANCVCVLGVGERTILYPDRLFRARLLETRLGPYLVLCFSDPLLRRSLRIASKSTAGHQRVSASAVADFRLPLPPPAVRDSIVQRAQILLAVADAVDRRLATALHYAVRLNPAVLAGAFRGDLASRDTRPPL